MPGARHTACTVEMASLTDEYDVAVIDEIQVRLPLPAGMVAAWHSLH